MKRPTVAADSPEAAQLLDSIDRWLRREVEPNVMRLEHADEWPAAMVERMRELGLFGATISPDYGGLGLSAQLYARMFDDAIATVQPGGCRLRSPVASA